RPLKPTSPVLSPLLARYSTSHVAPNHRRQIRLHKLVPRKKGRCSLVIRCCCQTILLVGNRARCCCHWYAFPWLALEGRRFPTKNCVCERRPTTCAAPNWLVLEAHLLTFCALDQQVEDLEVTSLPSRLLKRASRLLV